MYDMVIRNGKIVDGTGGDPYRGDVAIKGDRIIEVGAVDVAGKEELDAEGRCIVPGFIDGHTHLDAQIFWDPLCGIESAHGVTTVVMGNCGFTLAPGGEDDFDLVIRSIERAEDISRAAIERGVEWSWTTFSQYLEAVEKLPKVLNHASYVGHSAIRAAAMGERAFAEPADQNDLEKICHHVEEAMRAGAVGFSTSRNFNHLTVDDRPVASLYATWEEIVAVADVLRRLRGGTIQMTPEGPGDAEQMADFYQRLWSLSVSSGRLMLPVMGTGLENLEALDDFAVPGGRVIGEVHVHGHENIYGFRTTLPFDRFPTWQAVRSGSVEEQRSKFQDPVIRERLVFEGTNLEFGTSVGAEPSRPDFNSIYLLGDKAGSPSIGELARHGGKSPIEVIIDLGLETNFEQLFLQPRPTVTDERRISSLRHPRTVIASSDAGAHISQILNNTPTYVLSELVRERQLLTLAEAVRMLTADPADIWEFHDRGRIVPDHAADIVVFDEEAIGFGRPSVVNDLPDGGPRLTQPAAGITTVMVNGICTFKDGLSTGERPGRLIRHSSEGN